MQPVTACKQQIDYGTYHLSFQEVLLALGKGAAVSALFAYIFYRSMLAFGFMLRNPHMAGTQTAFKTAQTHAGTAV